MDINTDTRTRGHTKKLVVKRCHNYVPKYTFCNRVVNIWNSLPDDLITATSVNSFKHRLDTFWADQEVLYNDKANITEIETLRYNFQFNFFHRIHRHQHAQTMLA